MEEDSYPDLLTMTSKVVSAYVSRNSLPAAELPSLMVQVYRGLSDLSAPASAPVEESNEVAKATPAQIRKSITPDALISFVDGKPYKTLRKHLTTKGLTLEVYRARYGLPVDYPSVAPNYSAARSALAKELGLGYQRRKVEAASVPEVVPVPEAAPEPAARPKRAGRPRKVVESA